MAEEEEVEDGATRTGTNVIALHFTFSSCLVISIAD